MINNNNNNNNNISPSFPPAPADPAVGNNNSVLNLAS
jgi:hypothetical protein